MKITFTIHAPGEYDAQKHDLYRNHNGDLFEFTAPMPKADMAAAKGLILEHWRLER